MMADKKIGSFDNAVHKLLTKSTKKLTKMVTKENKARAKDEDALRKVEADMVDAEKKFKKDMDNLKPRVDGLRAANQKLAEKAALVGGSDAIVKVGLILANTTQQMKDEAAANQRAESEKLD